MADTDTRSPVSSRASKWNPLNWPKIVCGVVVTGLIAGWAQTSGLENIKRFSQETLPPSIYVYLFPVEPVPPPPPSGLPNPTDPVVGALKIKSYLNGFSFSETQLEDVAEAWGIERYGVFSMEAAAGVWGRGVELQALSKRIFRSDLSGDLVATLGFLGKTLAYGSYEYNCDSDQGCTKYCDIIESRYATWFASSFDREVGAWEKDPDSPIILRPAPPYPAINGGSGSDISSTGNELSSKGFQFESKLQKEYHKTKKSRDERLDGYVVSFDRGDSEVFIRTLAVRDPGGTWRSRNTLMDVGVQCDVRLEIHAKI